MADKVYLIHRRDELRGAKVLQDKVFAADNIMFMPDTVVSSINGSDGLVSSIDTKNVKTNMEENISVNGIFIAVGMKPNVSYINELVELDKAGYVVASEDGITSKKGIFVAGDMRTKVLRQVITAVSDGANAVASVEKYLREQN
jgi:thioredoxin reductase (NADPH)